MIAILSRHPAARLLIDWHFKVEPELREVYLIAPDDESSQDEPIRLLEVNDATFPTGTIEVFVFSPTDEIPFKTAIAEITPEEFEFFVRNPEALPEGWDINRAERFTRSEAPNCSDAALHTSSDGSLRAG